MDIAFNISTAQVEELQANDSLYVNVYEQNVGLPIWLTIKNTPSLRMRMIRQAIFLAIDKDLLTPGCLFRLWHHLPLLGDRPVLPLLL